MTWQSEDFKIILLKNLKKLSKRTSTCEINYKEQFSYCKSWSHYFYLQGQKEIVQNCQGHNIGDGIQDDGDLNKKNKNN